MIIKLTVDTDEEDSIPFELSNENLNNFNFVNIYLNDIEYTISVEDLYHSANLFYNIKKAYECER